jgi:AcrR family transcriptional regulator
MLGVMPRWEPDGFERLQNAALDLFAEQGFERTTVAEIAKRAGLSSRSFFNHFTDKREVLFGAGSERQREIIVREMAACPETLAPLDVVLRGMQAAADEMFEHRRDAVIRRRQIIEANPDLQERELGKRVALTTAVADALQARGVDPEVALLTARIGVVVQQTAMQRWTTSPEESRPLRELLTEALASVRTVLARDG